MNLLHHHHPLVPFEDDAGFPDPVGDRHALITRCNDLAHACREKDRTIAALQERVAHLERRKRRWLR